MKRRFDKYFPWLFTAYDFWASVISLFVCYVALEKTGVLRVSDFTAYLPLSVIWTLIAVLRKDYKLGRALEYDITFRNLIVTVLWFSGLTGILWMPLQSPSLQVIPVLGLGAGMIVLMGVFRIGMQLVLRQYRVQGNNYRNAVILGKGGTSPRLADFFRIRKDFGINFLGYFDDHAPCELTRGNINQFFEKASQLDLDLIYIQEHLDTEVVKRIIDFAEENYIKVKMIPGESLQLNKNFSFSRYGDFFVINVNEIPLDSLANSILKRSFDIVFASLVTIFILSWFIPLVGLLIKLESKGPIFFIQRRNGINNKEFKCLKFRSMTPNEYADVQQASKLDPRVTKIGSFLRTSSLDEMPQFLNVLLGDMSIVGPRPHTVPMNRTFKTQIQRYNSRHKIRPGITGLAQVRGFRGEIENAHHIRSRVRLDSFYINNWSFLLDIGIMVKTVHELAFNRDNAY